MTTKVNWGSGEANAWLIQQRLSGRSIESLSEEFEITPSRIEEQMRGFVWVWTRGSVPLTVPLTEEACRAALERFEAEDQFEGKRNRPKRPTDDKERRQQIREERERRNAAEEAEILILGDIAQIDRLEAIKDPVALGIIHNYADRDDRDPAPERDWLGYLIQMVDVGYEHGELRLYWDTQPPTPIPNTRKLVWIGLKNRANTAYECDVTAIGDPRRVLISKRVLERLAEISRERVKKLWKQPLEDRVKQIIREQADAGKRATTIDIDNDARITRAERDEARRLLAKIQGKRGRGRPRKSAK
jgi:hypothetical protein